jgi:hypothetical protein
MGQLDSTCSAPPLLLRTTANRRTSTRRTNTAKCSWRGALHARGEEALDVALAELLELRVGGVRDGLLFADHLEQVGRHLLEQALLDVELQVAFERRTLKPVFLLDRL